MRAGHIKVSFTVGAVFALLAGCSGGASSTWDCHRVNVPGGQTVECVGVAQQAEEVAYPCSPTLEDYGTTNCPPETGTTTDGTGDYGSKTQISSGGEAYGTSGGGGGGTGAGTTTGGGGAGSLVPECFFAPDLEYCGPGSYGGEEYGTPLDKPGNGSGSDGSMGGGGNGNGGTTKDETSSGGTTSGGTTSGGTTTDDKTAGGTPGEEYGGPLDKPGFDCVQHGTDVVCKKEPVCAEGLHPSPCGACVPNGEAASDCVPPAEGGCWFTGGGFVLSNNGKDTYGGNGKPMKDGRIQGEWNHVDHNANHAHGKVEYLVCRVAAGPGPSQPGGKKGLVSNQVYFGGHARWRSNDIWTDGYWFDVVAEDHGEPGNVKDTGSGNTVKGTMADYYHFTIRQESDPVAGVSGAVVYEVSGPFEGGNFQIHPNNNGHPYSTSSLPSWVALEH
jgi:hypothetical protein